MTFEDLERSLPNGFHDAKLIQISADYEKGSLLLKIEVLTGTPESSDPELYRRAQVTANKLYFCVIEPPDPRYPWKACGKPLRVSGDSGPTASPRTDALITQLPEGIPVYRFFVEDWNAFIYLAASDVELEWEATVTT